MNVSILISTWNNSKRLDITLDAIANCEIIENLKWEIVLVNNNSTDDTDKIVKKFESRLPILYILEPRQGLSWARNAGLKAARGELIIFTDDDIQPVNEWIKTYWLAFQKRKKDFYFGGPIESEFESQRPDEELLRWAPNSVKGLSLGNEERILTDKESFLAANWACPRYALERIGTFDITKGLNAASNQVNVGEEVDMMNRLKEFGLKPYYLPQTGVLHFVPSNKCTLTHIAARVEAGACYSIQNEIKNSKAVLNTKVPKWMYKKLILSFLKWGLARLSGKKGYQEYLSICVANGQIRGTRERK